MPVNTTTTTGGVAAATTPMDTSEIKDEKPSLDSLIPVSSAATIPLTTPGGAAMLLKDAPKIEDEKPPAPCDQADMDGASALAALASAASSMTGAAAAAAVSAAAQPPMATALPTLPLSAAVTGMLSGGLKQETASPTPHTMSLPPPTTTPLGAGNNTLNTLNNAAGNNGVKHEIDEFGLDEKKRDSSAWFDVGIIKV